MTTLLNLVLGLIGALPLPGSRDNRYPGSSSSVVALRFWAFETLHVFRIRPRRVFCSVGSIGSVVESRAANANCLNRYLTLVDPDCAARLREKSPIPAIRLIIPRADDRATADDYDPYRNKAMVARAYVQIFRLFESGKCRRWKTSFHMGVLSAVSAGPNLRAGFSKKLLCASSTFPWIF